MTAEIIRRMTTGLVIVAPPKSQGPPSQIVVGLDGSRRDEPALAFARDLAVHHGCPVTLVRVVTLDYDTELVALDMVSDKPADKTNDSLFHRLDHQRIQNTVQDAVATLQRAEAVMSAAGLDNATQLYKGSAISGLLHACQQTPGSLLVLATRPQRGLVAGSLTGDLLRKLDGTLVIVRADG